MLLVKRWIVPNVNTPYFTGLKIVLCENKEEKGLLGKLHNVRLLFCSPGIGPRRACCLLLSACSALPPQCAFAWLYWTPAITKVLGSGNVLRPWGLSNFSLPFWTCPRTALFVTGATAASSKPPQWRFLTWSFTDHAQTSQSLFTWALSSIATPTTWLGLTG